MLFVALLFAYPSFSQQTGMLKGKVTESLTGQAAAEATIYIARNPLIGVVSDVDGSYSLTLDTGSYRILCSYTGFLTDTFDVVITAGVTIVKNLALTPNSKLLETVVVSSGKFDQKLQDLTVSMNVLKPQLINDKNTTSIETALEQVPGLTIIDNDPQIRGGSGFTFGIGSRVAVLVDGIPLLSGDAGRPEWNYIPVENIEQVEVIKGASSVLYGSSALSGVINIRTAYPRSKPKTVINYSVGGYSPPDAPAQNWYHSSVPGYTNLNFLHSRIIHENLDLVIGGNFNMDQGYIGPPPRQGFIPPDLKKALLLDTIPTYTNNDMLKIRGRLNFNLRYRPGSVPGLSYGINGDGMLNKTTMVLAWLDDSSGLYRGYPGAVFLERQSMFNLDPFIKYSPADGITYSLVTRVFHTENNITDNLSNRGTIYYGEFQYQRIFKNADFTLTGGLANSMTYSHAPLYDSSGSPDNRVANVAGYVQLDKKFWGILNLSGGFRYEYYQTNSQPGVTAPVFRGGASIQVLPGTFLRASYGDGFRYPTITERYISAKAGLFGIFPNPDLQPETSQNYEVGIKQGFKIGDCMGYLDVAGFDQHYQNTIEYLFGVWDPNVSLFGFKFLNTGDSRVTGTDMTLALSTPEKDKKFGLTALVGYTYVDPVSLTPDNVYAVTKSLSGGAGQPLTYKNTSMDTTGNVLKYRFKNMIKADVEARIHEFAAGISYRYYSKMQNIDKAFQDIETITSNIPGVAPVKVINFWQAHNGFHVFDARVSYKLTQKHKLSLICSNVFNVAYMLRPMKIEAPRTVSVQYYYTF